MENKKEKRRFRRLNASCSVKYAIMAAMHSPYDTLSKDISAGGLRILTDRNFKFGTLLEMEIAMQNRPSLFAIGKVVWVKKPRSAGKDFETGVRFMNIEPADREAIMALAASHG